METTALEEIAKLAPIATATIAATAAIIALWSLYVQRDTARRRAAIDFFLKTEMDEKVIEAFNKFNEAAPHVTAMISRPTLDPNDPNYIAIRRWLNICELIAVGVNLGAFSERVSIDYWGDVLPDAFRKSRLLINRIRVTPDHGSPRTLLELENLCRRWGYC